MSRELLSVCLFEPSSTTTFYKKKEPADQRALEQLKESTEKIYPILDSVQEIAANKNRRSRSAPTKTRAQTCIGCSIVMPLVTNWFHGVVRRAVAKNPTSSGQYAPMRALKQLLLALPPGLARVLHLDPMRYGFFRCAVRRAVSFADHPIDSFTISSILASGSRNAR